VGARERRSGQRAGKAHRPARAVGRGPLYSARIVDMSAFTGPPNYDTVNDLYLSTEGWITRDNAAKLFNRQASAGDGNCLFNSLSISLWDTYRVNASPRDIRQNLCNYYKAAIAEITKLAEDVPDVMYSTIPDENNRLVKIQDIALEHIANCITSDVTVLNKTLAPYAVAEIITRFWSRTGINPDELLHMNHICNDKKHGEEIDCLPLTIVIGCNIVVLSVVDSTNKLMVMRYRLYDDDSPPLFVILMGKSSGEDSGHYDCLIPKDDTIERKGAGTLPTGIVEDLKPIHPIAGGASTMWPIHVQPILHGGCRRRAVPWA
jgi:hypothetical protein